MCDGSGRWFIINASPDLTAQIEAHRFLQPNSDSARNTPISGVFVTNGDLDHVLGLYSLREGGPLTIHATRATQNTARELGMAAVLDAFCGANWIAPPSVEFAPVIDGAHGGSDLVYRAITLPGNPPPFAKDAAPVDANNVAYEFKDLKTGGRLLVAPDVGEVNDELHKALLAADLVLFDGTFWSSAELCAVKPNARKAGEMGHVTIQDCSLELLRTGGARHKIYIHINNTNPVLDPESGERAAVDAAGIIIGADGMEVDL